MIMCSVMFHSLSPPQKAFRNNLKPLLLPFTCIQYEDGNSILRPRLEGYNTYNRYNNMCLQLPNTWHAPEGGNSRVLSELPDETMPDFLTL